MYTRQTHENHRGGHNAAALLHQIELCGLIAKDKCFCCRISIEFVSNIYTERPLTAAKAAHVCMHPALHWCRTFRLPNTSLGALAGAVQAALGEWLAGFDILLLLCVAAHQPGVERQQRSCSCRGSFAYISVGHFQHVHWMVLSVTEETMIQGQKLGMRRTERISDRTEETSLITIHSVQSVTT